MPDLDVTTHLPEIQKGNLESAYNTFIAIRDNTYKLPDAQRTALVKSWIEGVFNDSSALAQVDKPMLYIHLIEAARRLIIAEPNTYTDTWLIGLLDKIPKGRMAEFVENLIWVTWDSPDVLNKPLRDWIRGRIDIDTLNSAAGGVACRLLSLLWNTYDYDAICELVAAGIDTAQSSYYGRSAPPPYEGVYSGRVQPLEHVLCRYLRLASLPSLAPQSQRTDVDIELEELGAASPGGAALDKPGQRQRGVTKVAGAKNILEALTTKGTAQILTRFQDVEKSSLLAEFKQLTTARTTVTIWGFEHVRQPYVQAAHATATGNQPLRMMEIWQTVQLALNRGWYEALLKDPDATIPRLVDEGVTKMKEVYANRPAEYLYWTLPDFEAAFRRQCTAFLRSYSEQPPRAKFPTAALRGYDEGAYLGALACIAGLWWAQSTGGRIFYCLDGVKYEDVVGSKQLKITYINTYLDKDGPYVESITLAEIRHILKNWSSLRKTVTFMRKGEPVPVEEIEALAQKLEDAERNISERRNAPSDMSVFRGIVARLDPNLAGTLNDHDLMRVAAQVYLLETAASAKREKVLLEYLRTKGCRVLFDQGILPEGFAESYERIITETDPSKRAALGSELIADMENAEVSGQPRLCAYLRNALIPAIRRHSGATA